VLVELSVMEQRYQAVLAVVQDGWKVVEAARRVGVSRAPIDQIGAPHGPIFFSPRRRLLPSNDDWSVSDGDSGADGEGTTLLGLYDAALPQVYGYLLPRCGSEALAEDLTGETFLAAVDALQRDAVPRLTVAWLVGVARHKLVDHWRRQFREERALPLTYEAPALDLDPWDDRLDVLQARAALAVLGPHHRAALTLRYVDGLSVPEVAGHLGRTVHATEALLVRARAAFRRAYEEGRSDGPA
jgi:RNA polymerase sigma-70 factor (ECF subfamily)